MQYRYVNDRQYRLFWIGKFPHQNLTLELQANHKEEYCHQSIVDPMVKGKASRR